MRAVALPEEEHSRYAGIDDGDSPRAQGPLQRAARCGRTAVKDRRVYSLFGGGGRALRRVDAKADDRVRTQASRNRVDGKRDERRAGTRDAAAAEHECGGKRSGARETIYG